MPQTTLASLCTGYGGLDLAVERHYDARMVWCAEIDRHARTVIEHHWPGVPNLGDITRIDWATVPPVEVLTAGYPCQPFSHAGPRRGHNDDRNIWPHIRDAIDTVRPTRVVLENVVGHLSLGGPEVVETLAALGYCVKWGVVRASDAGAAHRRARLFISAVADTDHPDMQRRGRLEQP